jgi:hypothetical protein
LAQHWSKLFIFQIDELWVENFGVGWNCWNFFCIFFENSDIFKFPTKNVFIVFLSHFLYNRRERSVDKNSLAYHVS